MKKRSLTRTTSTALLCAAMAWPLAASAQNIALVNGKPVPKARFDAFHKQIQAQAAAQGQQLPPDVEQRIRDKIVMDEMFTQEAEKRGLSGSAEFKQQMDQARQMVLIQALLADQAKKNPVTDAEIQAEYDKSKAQAGKIEYRARHILVDKEDEAKALIAQLKAGAKFDELAKKSSKDTGSGAKGGDLDFANPAAFVPEFSQAMVKLQKGEMTDTPVKSSFGYHIIKLDDTREAKFPALEEVKAQVKQGLEQQKLAAFRDDVRAKAKTDYKFSK